MRSAAAAISSLQLVALKGWEKIAAMGFDFLNRKGT